MAPTSEAQIIRVAAFLRQATTLRTQECIMADKRVDAFKGTSATRAILSPAYAKLAAAGRVPTAVTAEAAGIVMHDLLQAGLVLRAKMTGTGKMLQPDLARTWSDEALYVWIYEGSQWQMIVGSLMLLVVVLALMMFPLWPVRIRSKTSLLLNWAMYGAIVIVIFLLALSVVRMIVYLITYFTLKPGVWLFPNLWADCGVIESFKPVWDWDMPAATVQAKTKKDD